MGTTMSASTALFMIFFVALYIDGGRKLWALAMLHSPEFGVAADDREGKVPVWYFVGFMLIWPDVQIGSYAALLWERLTSR